MTNLPEWIENVDAIGMSEQEGFRKLREALAIAWEALENAKGLGNSFGPDHPMPMSTYTLCCGAVEAMRRIEELWK